MGIGGNSDALGTIVGAGSGDVIAASESSTDATLTAVVSTGQ
jgi:hypothetical protein